jgi:hypothetical protein
MLRVTPPALASIVSLGFSVAVFSGCASTPEPDPIRLDLAAYASVATLDDVCPEARGDELCAALREADTQGTPAAYARARELVRSSLAPARNVAAHGEADEPSHADPATRWFIRERSLGLLVWHTLAAQAAPPEDAAAYANAADEVLARLFPAYAPARFRAARVRMPPEASCGETRAAFLFFPGVVRVETLDEFAPARARIESEFPCAVTYKVESGSFLTPAENAREGCSALERIALEQPGAPIHSIGYSQGVRNALETFVTCPGPSAAVRSLFGMNSAAHGSAVADVIALALPLPRLEEARCVGRGALSRWWCENVRMPSFGLPLIARAALRTQGQPPDDRDYRMRDGKLERISASEYTNRRIAGARSLSTYASKQFWHSHGDALPRHPLYFSFRSIITDEARNLPASNRTFYRSVFQAGGTAPWNDMQVRLIDQHLGGPLRESEIVWPVAEGNHWQWALDRHHVPGVVMSDEMFEGFPRVELLLAHAETLAEFGEFEAR